MVLLRSRDQQPEFLGETFLLNIFRVSCILAFLENQGNVSELNITLKVQEMFIVSKKILEISMINNVDGIVLVDIAINGCDSNEFAGRHIFQKRYSDRVPV